LPEPVPPATPSRNGRWREPVGGPFMKR
jgi:hypothetical protein